MVSPEQTRRANDAAQRISAMWGTSLEVLKMSNGDRRVNEARQLVATALRDNGFTLTSIGDLLDRHHTTILYALRQASERSARDEEFSNMLTTAATLVEEVLCG